MNRKQILLAGLITAVVGVGMGIVLARLFEPPYTSKHYRNLDRVYGVVGGVGGFLFGVSQEALRQLQKERDADELNAQHHEESNQDHPL